MRATFENPLLQTLAFYSCLASAAINVFATLPILVFVWVFIGKFMRKKDNYKLQKIAGETAEKRGKVIG